MLIVKFHPFRFELEHLPIAGFLVCPETHWESHLKKCAEFFRAGLVFVSPGGVMYADTYEDYLRLYRIRDLTQEEAISMQEIFGTHVTTTGIGMFTYASAINMIGRNSCESSLH